jgi:hypothetical protein
VQPISEGTWNYREKWSGTLKVESEKVRRKRLFFGSGCKRWIVCVTSIFKVKIMIDD